LSVKSVRASIAFSFSANSFAISSLAFVFATGFTFAISPVPAVLAVSTAASVVAASIASVAFLASSAAFSLAVCFSSGVKSSRASIAATLSLRASSTAFLAAGFSVFLCLIYDGLSIVTQIQRQSCPIVHLLPRKSEGLGEPYLGKVVDCTNDIIYFSTKQNILQISISDILKVSLAEELDYEQT